MSSVAHAPCSVKPAPAGTCRLTLTVRGTDYRIIPMDCDPESGAMFAFRLKKVGGDGAIYDVAQTRYGSICTCADFEFRRAGYDPAGCKHIRSLRALRLLPRGGAQ